jgi:predicted RNase H-like nuclease (RuvC/YqgF family)
MSLHDNVSEAFRGYVEFKKENERLKKKIAEKNKTIAELKSEIAGLKIAYDLCQSVKKSLQEKYDSMRRGEEWKEQAK